MTVPYAKRQSLRFCVRMAHIAHVSATARCEHLGIVVSASAKVGYPNCNTYACVSMLISAALAAQEGKIDKRHGDPDAGGKNSGQKAVRIHVLSRTMLATMLLCSCFNPIFYPSCWV